MLRTIHTLIVIPIIAVLFLIISCFTLISYGMLHLLRQKHAALRVLKSGGKTLSRVIIRGMGGKVHIKGLEKLPPESSKICIISNHQSYIDIPLLVGYFPLWGGFIAKEELRKIPILRQWMDSMGCVYIRRGNARSSVKMILDGVKRIEAGYPLIIFPEGTRSRSNKVKKFKEGSIKLATRAQAVIVPVTILNSYQLWEKDLRTKPTELYLILHDAIDTSAISGEEERQLPVRVQEIIAGKYEPSESEPAAGR